LHEVEDGEVRDVPQLLTSLAPLWLHSNTFCRGDCGGSSVVGNCLTGLEGRTMVEDEESLLSEVMDGTSRGEKCEKGVAVDGFRGTGKSGRSIRNLERGKNGVCIAGSGNGRVFSQIVETA